MAFVVDASIVLSQALGEDSAAADRAMDLAKATRVFAPALWWYEVRNGLLINERRGRLTGRQTMAAMRALSELAIELDTAPQEPAILTLARSHRLTVYDTAYLELALRLRLPLATLDEALAAAARAEGVAALA